MVLLTKRLDLTLSVVLSSLVHEGGDTGSCTSAVIGFAWEYVVVGVVVGDVAHFVGLGCEWDDILNCCLGLKVVEIDNYAVKTPQLSCLWYTLIDCCIHFGLDS